MVRAVVLVVMFLAGLPGPGLAQTPAKQLFGAVAAGSAQRPAPIGSYAKGCLAGGVELPETGPTWQAMRLSRNRNWAHPETVRFIERLSRKAARQPGWKGLYIGDIAQPRGGPVSGHASHQLGLDVDIWMRPATDLDLSRQTRENISSISMRRDGGAYVNASWTKAQFEIIRAAARDKSVARIFVFPGAKVQMCKDAKGNRDWLRKVRPWWGHYSHFHVRLECPRGAAGCVEQTPPPPGDGCEAAQAWVDDILNPKPPGPAGPPKPPLILADLPQQCAGILSSQ